MRRPDRWAAVCGLTGPWVGITTAFQRQVHCNRIPGHEGAHREYDRNTFAVIAEWAEPTEPDPRKRRKVKT